MGEGEKKAGGDEQRERERERIENSVLLLFPLASPSIHDSSVACLLSSLWGLILACGSDEVPQMSSLCSLPLEILEGGYSYKQLGETPGARGVVKENPVKTNETRLMFPSPALRCF